MSVNFVSSWWRVRYVALLRTAEKILFIIDPEGQYGIDLKSKSLAELRKLRNTIYAQYGRQFKSKDLQSYFDKQWWYVPNKKYSDKMLTSSDKSAIAKIQQEERAK